MSPNPLVWPRTLALVGPGRAGTSMAAWLQTHGALVLQLVGGGAAGAGLAQDVLGAHVPWCAEPGGAAPELVLFGVPDDALESAAARAAAAWPDAAAAYHLSGALGLGPLEPFARRGSAVVAFHPLHSFPTRRPPERGLAGAPVAISARLGVDAARAGQIAEMLGGTPMFLPEDARALYHAAASLAHNAGTSLAALAIELACAAGAKESVVAPALVALLQQGLAAGLDLGFARALTGPVARGDLFTLQRHRQALHAAAPQWLDLHAELLRVQCWLADQQGDPAVRQRLVAWMETGLP